MGLLIVAMSLHLQPAYWVFQVINLYAFVSYITLFRDTFICLLPFLICAGFCYVL